jgi:hypothetical protein
MTAWGPVRAVRVGGLVAVGFVDERRVVVGSHDGLGVLDASTGQVLDRQPDPRGEYAWFQERPPTARWNVDGVSYDVAVAGLWGGALARSTDDGWTCRVDGTGATLFGPGSERVVIDDSEGLRACGFSPGGRVFVLATSSTLHVAVRPDATLAGCASG